MATEPSPRWGHWAAGVGGKLFIYGGCTKNFPEQMSELGAIVHTFHQRKETWRSRPANVQPYPGLYHGASAYSGSHLYLYGGKSGTVYSDSLYRLDISSFEWLRLTSGPSRKDGCGMVYHKGKLVLFGGYGFPSLPIQSGARFVKRSDLVTNMNKGWLNELHCFNLNKGKVHS